MPCSVVPDALLTWRPRALMTPTVTEGPVSSSDAPMVIAC
jgi:hypothetical protein